MTNIPILTVIGRSGSGKTTFLEKLIRELTRRGYRLGTVKHHSHSGFEIDHPGKDSWRFARAGSHHVIVAAPDKIASYRLLDHELTLDEVVADVVDVDLILVEGYRGSGRDCIEIIRREVSTDLIGDLHKTIAILTDTPLEVHVPQFGLEDVVEVADLVETWLKRQKGG
jgi:molybdopterin-guanine dinucleotide biosynthesis adapter protein